jgi:hypothetical protein
MEINFYGRLHSQTLLKVDGGAVVADLVEGSFSGKGKLISKEGRIKEFLRLPSACGGL